MATIFDGPIPPVDLKDPSGIGLFLWSAGDAARNFTGVASGLLFDRFPIDGEGLPGVRKVEVAFERGGGPDLPDLDQFATQMPEAWISAAASRAIISSASVQPDGYFPRVSAKWNESEVAPLGVSLHGWAVQMAAAFLIDAESVVEA